MGLTVFRVSFQHSTAPPESLALGHAKEHRMLAGLRCGRWAGGWGHYLEWEHSHRPALEKCGATRKPPGRLAPSSKQLLLRALRDQLSPRAQPRIPWRLCPQGLDTHTSSSLILYLKGHIFSRTGRIYI